MAADLTSGPASTQGPASLGQRLAGLRAARPLPFFVGRRLVALVLLGVGITLIAFVLTHLVPGDPAEANLGQRAGADPAAVRAFREHYGLDQPLPTQYGLYLLHLVQGDLGSSQQSHRAVRADLAEYIPATAELALCSMLLAGVLGVALGVLAAVRRNRLTDQVLRVVSLGGISMPTFWLALVALYVLFFKLGLLPGSGRLDPGVQAPPHLTGLFTVDAVLAGQLDVAGNALQHLALPALVLAAYNIGLLTRFTRSAVLEVIDEDYVRAARAKGLPERRVIGGHVLRAALPPIVTVAGLAFANVMTGTVLVENIFAWPGIGQYAYRSATTLDLPAIMGVTLFVAVVYIIVNLCVDVLHAAIDPRVRLT
ncbi:MAG: ABC transporter permease [Candidatus Dormibacteraeota bacterium]|nr:ABC transporter permease [Candidatus Dormibacteraeota bacterium]